MTKNKNPAGKNNREKVIDELFTSLSDEDSSDADIEANVAGLGTEADSAEKAAKPDKKTRFLFGYAVFVIIMAVIGLISTVLFVVGQFQKLTDNTDLKEDLQRFLLPVVANDIAPFEHESELSNSAKINCSVWNILLNHDTSRYNLSSTGEYLIPEYDVEVSCKEIFGASAGVNHRSVTSQDVRFSYDETNHLYSCTRDLRYVNYTPRISKMSESGGTYTLIVDYLPPSASILAENGVDAQAEKTMEYVINRYNGENTLMAVHFTANEVLY